MTGTAGSLVRMVAILGMAVAAVPVAAQQQASKNTLTVDGQFDSPPATVDDLAWLAGSWHGEGMGGTFDETWLAPVGNAMSGVFRLIVDGEVRFHEILAIVPEGDSLVLRLKHFHPDLKGWEEKDDTVNFRLVKVADGEANFNGLTFRRVSDNEMHIYLLLHREGQAAREETFIAKRAVAPEQAASRARAAIDRVLEIDRLLSHQRDETSRHAPLAFAVQLYVDGLHATSFENCPDDFMAAFAGHREAWQASLDFLRQHDSVRGEMHEAFDQIREADEGDAKRLDELVQEIMDTWQDVQAAINASRQRP